MYRYKHVCEAYKLLLPHTCRQVTDALMYACGWERGRKKEQKREIERMRQEKGGGERERKEGVMDSERDCVCVCVCVFAVCVRVCICACVYTPPTFHVINELEIAVVLQL